MTDKLTRAQREQIIFAHLKGKDDPLYEVIETKHGKYIVKPKQIELEEEETNNEESNNESEEDDYLPPPPPRKNEKTNKQSCKQERRFVPSTHAHASVPASQSSKHRTKQDAKRLLDALTSLINTDDSSYESSSDDYQQAPPLVEPSNYKPTNLSFKRRKLVF